MSILKDKCNNWIRFSKYERKYVPKKSYVYFKGKRVRIIEYNPFEIADKLAVDFLNIGWSKANSKGNYRELAEEFVNKYGTLTMRADKNIDEYEEETLSIIESEKLYMHFFEYNRDMRYPEQVGAEPAWSLEPLSVPMTVKLIDNIPTLIWNNANLLTAIKLAYSLLTTEENTRLKFCKHCLKAYFGANPKSEFCSPRCRNQWNVYRSREKNK